MGNRLDMEQQCTVSGAATNLTGSPTSHKRARHASSEDAVLRRLSQDLFPTMQRTGSGYSGSGCDSSDCLFCQGLNHGPFCSQTVSQRICSWLGRRLSDAAALSPADAAVVTAAAPVSGVQQGAGSNTCTDSLKRAKRGSHTEDAACKSWPLCVPDDEPAAGSSSSSGISLPTAWKWRQEFATRKDPAPCSMVQLAEFCPPARPDCRSNPYHCDLVCGLEFSPDGRLLVAAGVSKQLRLYTLESLLDPGLEPQQLPVAVVRTFAKVSSLAWNPDSDGVVTLGDYDGVLTQVHVCSGHIVSELEDAHGGRRVWSVRHSPLRRHLCLSASEDRTARVWSGPGLDSCAAVIRPPCASTVCCADFSATHEQYVSVACSSHKAYLYDLRAVGRPLAVLAGHTRPVSYARFLGAGQLVSASTDGSLACWDVRVALGLQQASHLPQLAGEGGLCGRLPAAAVSEEQQWQQEGLQHAANGAPFGKASSSTGRGGVGRLPSGGGHTTVGNAAAARSYQAWCGSGGSGSLNRGIGGLGSAGGCSCIGGCHGGCCCDVAVVRPWKSFRGHTNAKNFVGLSVRPEDGLLACGSETSEVFAYHTSWDAPLATFPMGSGGGCSTSSTSSDNSVATPLQRNSSSGVDGVPLQRSGSGLGGTGEPFVSAVAWQSWEASQRLGLPAVLAAASSLGNIKILSLVDT